MSDSSNSSGVSFELDSEDIGDTSDGQCFLCGESTKRCSCFFSGDREQLPSEVYEFPDISQAPGFLNESSHCSFTPDVGQQDSFIGGGGSNNQTWIGPSKEQLILQHLKQHFPSSNQNPSENHLDRQETTSFLSGERAYQDCVARSPLILAEEERKIWSAKERWSGDNQDLVRSVRSVDEVPHPVDRRLNHLGEVNVGYRPATSTFPFAVRTGSRNEFGNIIPLLTIFGLRTVRDSILVPGANISVGTSVVSAGPSTHRMGDPCFSSTIRVVSLTNTPWSNNLTESLAVKPGFVTPWASGDEGQSLMVILYSRRSENLFIPAGTHIANIEVTPNQ